ncbi:MAG: extracellular solute-binding protein [Alphaproteobacteria bacterium]|nr:extracellular solute-binding protein [Alphaproteobacteria bacterium]
MTMTIQRRALLATPLALPALAQTSPVEISFQYSIPELFRGLMEEMTAAFMRANPNVRVTIRAPEQGYEEILQRHLRDAVTRQLPDVAFHGLNRQRTLVEREIPVDLKPFMAADARIAAQGYSESLLSLGQVGAAQTGIGFALSTPILYYNVEQLRRAGGNPEALPTTWAEVAALARAIHGTAENLRHRRPAHAGR